MQAAWHVAQYAAHHAVAVDMEKDPQKSIDVAVDLERTLKKL